MNQLTPLRSEGREANSFLVTTWPLFKPTKKPVWLFRSHYLLRKSQFMTVRLDKRAIK